MLIIVIIAALVAIVSGASIARAVLLGRMLRSWQGGRYFPLVLTRKPVPLDGDQLLLAVAARAWAPFKAEQRSRAEQARPRLRLGATSVARAEGKLVRWRGPHVDVGRGAFAITSRKVIFTRGATRHEFPLRADVRWQVHNGLLEARDARATLIAAYDVPAPTLFVKLIAAARGKAAA